MNNETVLEKMRMGNKVMSTIERRKLENHTKYKLSIREMFRNKGTGRRKKGTRTLYSKTTTELFKVAVNKVVIARMAANILNE